MITALNRLINKAREKELAKTKEKTLNIIYKGREITVTLVFENKWMVGLTDVATGITEWVDVKDLKEAEVKLSELASYIPKTQ